MPRLKHGRKIHDNANAFMEYKERLFNEGVTGSGHRASDLTHCSFCHRMFNTEDYRWRIIPKMKLSKKVKKLKLRYARNTKRIGRFHKHLLNLYENSCNRLAITCKICGRTKKIQCQRRSDKRAQEHTYSSTEEKIASYRANKESGCKHASIAHSSQSKYNEPSKSSSASKKKKGANYLQLKAMLETQQQQQQSYSGLKDFLSDLT